MTARWTFTPAHGLELADRLAAYLRALRAADATALGDAQPMWQSRGDLHQHAELAQLVALIDEAARSALALLQVDCALDITGLWGNISRGPGALHEHSHPNNYLSGVFYACMPQGAGAMAFKDPRPQTRVLRPHTLRDAPLNALELQIAPTTGTLLLFPAWLEHSVRPSPAASKNASAWPGT